MLGKTYYEWNRCLAGKTRCDKLLHNVVYPATTSYYYALLKTSDTRLPRDHWCFVSKYKQGAPFYHDPVITAKRIADPSFNPELTARNNCEFRCRWLRVKQPVRVHWQCGHP